LPASIDAAFDDLELAQEITDRMLAHLLSDMRLWLADGIDFGHVAVNVSAADFKRRDFAENLLEQLARHSIPASRIQVEVTETVFLGRDAEYVAEALKTLSTNGIRIALDDFGTGYSSLSHLKQFPVDIVKIDRSFLRDLHGDEHNAAIIRTVVSLGRSLKLDVVAEGVETTDQALYLSAQGCPFGQGYLFGKAAPAARVPHLIKAAAARGSQAA
jgi:EAL domain-containing protein (putative c-di-GMP-specific phosphodiesterase class I)